MKMQFVRGSRRGSWCLSRSSLLVLLFIFAAAAVADTAPDP